MSDMGFTRTVRNAEGLLYLRRAHSLGEEDEEFFFAVRKAIVARGMRAPQNKLLKIAHYATGARGDILINRADARPNTPGAMKVLIVHDEHPSGYEDEDEQAHQYIEQMPPPPAQNRQEPAH